jgi:non-specific serine/threonine protein kinase/serine/threonine-protein kinase
MTPEEWQRVRPILESALELDSAHRTAYLDGACADRSLRSEVESLIAVHQQAGTDVLSSGPVPGFVTEDEPCFRLLPGKRIGSYEILEEIAVGGMGAVYRAIRADGQYKQQVALKIVRSELGAEFAGTRFKNERQILASLGHPNIAKILDGGTTADGLPYFVMEFIDGLPITEYCNKNRLTIDERLKIFRTVCSAVHYAHQHLVIHRDIKPSNILITSDGIPKLLDFGIAKILDPSLLAENAAVTLAGLWVMTPEYASPEQLRGEAITTATDVYSLGLVLYELLAGHRAYHLASHLPHEIARAVLETDPEKPSTAIRRKDEIAEQGKEKAPPTPGLISGLRADSPEKLHRRIAGDLDNIVLKAIRKEPRERYNSADQLSEDIRRHLEHLPVLARKSTVAYRCRKYVLRHKIGVTAALLVFVSLLSGFALTLREARIARANEIRAEKRFNDVRRLANSLMFEVHDSIRDLPGATAARKLIIQRAQEYLDSLAQESKSDPALLRELASAYSRLASVQGNARDANVGDTPKAVQNYRKASALLETDASLEPTNREARLDWAQANLNLGLCLLQTGDKNGNKEATQKALGILESLAASNPDDQKTQALLGEAYAQTGFSFFADSDLNQALNYHEKALGIYQRLAKLDPKNELYQTQLSFSHKRVGGVLIVQKQLPAALEHERVALEIDEALLALHPDSVKTRFNITFTYSDTGYILGKQGDFDAALSYYRKALEIRAALAGADPQDTKARAGLSNTHTYIGWNLRQKEDFAGALDSYKRGLALRELLLEKDPANEPLRFSIAQSQSGIGDVYAAIALGPKIAPADRLAYCRESETWNRRALPMWLQMKAKGKVTPSDLEVLVKINQNLERCGHITAQLNHLP